MKSLANLAQQYKKRNFCYHKKSTKMMESFLENVSISMFGENVEFFIEKLFFIKFIEKN